MSSPAPSSSWLASSPNTGVASTAASSPPPSDESKPDDQPSDSEENTQRFERLQYMLSRSSIYAGMLEERMKTKRDTDPLPQVGKKRTRTSDAKPSSSKRVKLQDGDAVPERPAVAYRQSALITGGTLKDYQLEGVAWMISLYENGISGILADEMGLGKTLQTIAFNAHLREKEVSVPFLIVCPLSVVHNWAEEFAKFAPSIPVCVYHGTPDERADLRRTVMRPVEDTGPGPESVKRGSQPARKARKGARRKSVLKPANEQNDEDGESTAAQTLSTFPVVLTTYEMIIKDRQHLAPYDWGYIVVDEGHRLKNFDSKLMREIKQYHSAGRLLLTGTPLHNNLAELWSLLNFILPDIFSDLDSFQAWFNLPHMQSSLPSEQSSQIISSLHAILKPFLLRRMKGDVEAALPPKKEYVLYAPLSERQHAVYDAVLKGNLRDFLIEGRRKVEEEKSDVEIVGVGRRLRSDKDSSRQRTRYDVDEDDDEYFDKLESGELEEQRQLTREREAAEIGRDYQLKSTIKQVNGMKLQNTVMQLRKVCSHPFLFDWPLDPRTFEPVVNDDLVNVSGKMMVLDRLLGELFKRKHKVLLFSQFTTMLDIIEAWAQEFKGWSLCRIDGSTSVLERRQEMNRFQNGGDDPDAPCLFLLSTRAGGLGVNLTAADTVIFYDQDWNPQMDIQAQDRAHRIGQTKPVLIFRLVSAHTVETKIMQRATEKRRLEALIIAKGKFKMPMAAAATNKPATMAEIAASLLKLEGEKIEVVRQAAAGKASVISDSDMEALLDRSPGVFADRGKGWTSAEKTKSDDDGKTQKTGEVAFEVFEPAQDDGNLTSVFSMTEDGDE